MNRLFLLLTLALSLPVAAQYNFELLGKRTYSGQNLSGSWGYSDTVNNKEYALVGTTKGLSIVNITNPATPTEVKFINGSQGTWREVQTWKNFAYITQDNNSNTNSEGVLIYDLSLIPGGKADTFKGTTANDLIIRSHSLFIDEKGYLYLNGGRLNINGTINNGTAIYNLNPDPKHPVFVGYTPSPTGSTENYVHDCYARNDTMFEAHIYNNRFTVWDIRNRSNPVKIQDFATPYNSIHNMWLSNDSKTLFVSHEQFNLPMEAYDISDLSNIRQLCEFKINPTNQEIAHNVHVTNNYVYSSYYSDGVALFDASDPANVICVGYYDTQPTTTRAYNGVWGAYGFYRSGIMTLSDMGKGLFIVKPTYVRAARLQGLVTDSISGTPIVGATISFVDTTISVASNSEGFYKTGTPKAGTFTIKIEKSGYIPKFVAVTLNNGGKVILNVQLTPVLSALNHQKSIEDQLDIKLSKEQALVSYDGNSSLQKLELYDINGRIRAFTAAQGYQVSLRLPELAPGIYFLRTTLENGDFSVRKFARD